MKWTIVREDIYISGTVGGHRWLIDADDIYSAIDEVKKEIFEGEEFLNEKEKYEENNLLCEILNIENKKIESSFLHVFIEPDIVIQSIWKEGLIIKDDDEKRLSSEMMLIDRSGEGRLKKYVKVEEGKVIEKPEDVDILGEIKGNKFILRGITLKNKYHSPQLMDKN